MKVIKENKLSKELSQHIRENPETVLGDRIGYARLLLHEKKWEIQRPSLFGSLHFQSGEDGGYFWMPGLVTLIELSGGPEAAGITREELKTFIENASENSGNLLLYNFFTHEYEHGEHRRHKAILEATNYVPLEREPAVMLAISTIGFSPSLAQFYEKLHNIKDFTAEEFQLALVAMGSLESTKRTKACHDFLVNPQVSFDQLVSDGRGIAGQLFETLPPKTQELRRFLANQGGTAPHVLGGASPGTEPDQSNGHFDRKEHHLSMRRGIPMPL